MEGQMKKLLAVAAVATVLSCAAAHAGPLPIVSYDIDRTPVSGFGCWSHTYGGTITHTGRTISGAACSGNGYPIANYSGGGGTLNDGVYGNLNATHLFSTANADDGQPIDPVITLHLGGTYVIKSISIFGGDVGGNIIPGALESLTVEVGGASAAVITLPFGPPNAGGVPQNELDDLTATALAGVETDRIVLRNFS